jgi:hypothetical protein
MSEDIGWQKTNTVTSFDGVGRRPLLIITHGRPHKVTLCKKVYRWTRLCQYRGEWSYYRDIEEPFDT